MLEEQLPRGSSIFSRLARHPDPHRPRRACGALHRRTIPAAFLVRHLHGYFSREKTTCRPRTDHPGRLWMSRLQPLIAGRGTFRERCCKHRPRAAAHPGRARTNNHRRLADPSDRGSVPPPPPASLPPKQARPAGDAESLPKAGRCASSKDHSVARLYPLCRSCGDHFRTISKARKTADSNRTTGTPRPIPVTRSLEHVTQIYSGRWMVGAPGRAWTARNGGKKGRESLEAMRKSSFPPLPPIPRPPPARG